MEGGENKDNLRRKAEARRRKLKDLQAQRIAEASQTDLNDPQFQNLVTQFNRRENKTPMERVSTTPSTGSVTTPTPGTGFDTLTEEQKEALKRRGGA
tara:strand:+ start:280 stop:570 length:291 start_codon:yes stop_codon:yes gene_type:complete